MPANCRCALEWQDLRSAFEKKAPNWGKRQFLTTMSLASYPEKKHYLYISISYICFYKVGTPPALSRVMV